MNKSKQDKIDHLELKKAAMQSSMNSVDQDIEKLKKECDSPAPSRVTKKKERIQKIADFYAKRGIV